MFQLACNTTLDAVADRQPKTVSADKAYDTAGFVVACRARKVT